MRTGYINFANNLFVGVQELKKFQEFISQTQKQPLIQSKSFGLMSFEGNYKVESGATAYSFKIANKSVAIDVNNDLIVLLPIDNIVIPDITKSYHVLISFKNSIEEIGTVSIDTQGNLIGTNTEFTKVLRNNSNGLASLIKFTNTVGNISEYEVTDVINDTHAILSGSFANESDLTYTSIGTFCPDTTQTESEKYTYRYDDCNLELIEITGGDFTIENEKFLIANISVVDDILLIEDKREKFWTSVDQYLMNTTDNPLIGVESVKWMDIYSTLDKNIVNISWSFRVQLGDWSINAGLRQISILAGEGGIFKNINAFTNGDFNGWRVYKNNGEYDVIKTSVKSGNAIILTLSKLVNYEITESLLLTPDVEGIEIIVAPDSIDYIDQLNKIIYSDINVDSINIELQIPSLTSYKYNFKYRYKTFNYYSEIKAFPSAISIGINGNGYYSESSFENDGTLKVNVIDRTRKIYTYDDSLGYIEFIPNENAYNTFVSRLITGDKFGITKFSLNNSQPIKTLTVGTDTQIQVIQGSISLSADHYINLPTVGIKNGNNFRLFFEVNYLPNDYNVFITQDYVNPGSPGTILFTSDDFYKGKSETNNLIIDCFFDGTNWFIKNIISVTDDLVESGATLGISEVAVTDVDRKLITEARGDAFNRSFTTSGGNNGTSVIVARGNHIHDDIYYTKTYLDTDNNTNFVAQSNRLKARNFGVTESSLPNDVLPNGGLVIDNFTVSVFGVYCNVITTGANTGGLGCIQIAYPVNSANVAFRQANHLTNTWNTGWKRYYNTDELDVSIGLKADHRIDGADIVEKARKVWDTITNDYVDANDTLTVQNAKKVWDDSTATYHDANTELLVFRALDITKTNNSGTLANTGNASITGSVHCRRYGDIVSVFINVRNPTSGAKTYQCQLPSWAVGVTSVYRNNVDGFTFGIDNGFSNGELKLHGEFLNDISDPSNGEMTLIMPDSGYVNEIITFLTQRTNA